MNPTSNQGISQRASFDARLSAAREGSPRALGELLETCRNYLLMVAANGIGGDLKAKAGASDLVQETFLEAQQDFRQFRGTTETELNHWLGRILQHNLANFRRHFRETERRAVAREVPLAEDNALGDCSAGLAADSPTPSDEAVRCEQDLQLDAALARLPDDYRLAIQLRHEKGLSLAQVGEAMGRSADAARKVWSRAVEQLGRELGRQFDDRLASQRKPK